MGRFRWALMLSVAAAAAILLVAVPQEAEAKNYWAVGLPTPYTAGPIQPSTLVSATNYDLANVGTVTFLQAGTVPVGATAVPGGTTGQYTIGQFYYGSQISPVASLLVQTSSDYWEVMQTTAVQGASATTDATRLLPEDDLGNYYVVATAANFVSYLNPQPGYFTVVSIKDGTQVRITTSGPTAASTAPPGVAGCATPNTVCAMNGGPYTYTVNRGFALHIETIEGQPTCIIALVGCPPIDLTGSIVQATTPVAVFGGNYCIALYDSSCDTINEQMQPESMGGQTFIICSASQSRTGDLDMIKIRSTTGPAQVNFAVPVSGVSTTVVGPTYSTFLLNQDTVITTDPGSNLQVFQYLARSNVRSQQTPTQNPNALLGTYGDPAYVQIPPMQRVSSEHWFYTNPTWDNYLYIGAAMGTVVQLSQTSPSGGPTGGVAGLPRPIGTSGYYCHTPLLPSPTGGQGATWRLNATGPVSVQVLGLAYYTAYFYDTGALPFLPPPPAEPLPVQAEFKVQTSSNACGPRPMTFRDLSEPGSFNITSWTWAFGDGTYSTQRNPTHTYATPGTYQVTLTVEDSSGDTDTFALTVVATQGDPCLLPTDPQDDGYVPRPPRDDVDPEIAGGDEDGDGVTNAFDNCMDKGNADQADRDVDGIGNTCDADQDGDLTPDLSDNCVEIRNANQADLDEDGVGNVCDSDMDDDMVDNEADNCPMADNASQEDGDGNGVGDACDMLRLGAAGQSGSDAALGRNSGGLSAVGLGGNFGQMLLYAGLGLLLVVGAVVAVVLARRRA